MQPDERDRLVSLIYDAALDGARWPEVAVAIAEATRCRQATIELHDPGSKFTRRIAPLCDPAYQLSHQDFFGRDYSLSGRTERFAIGAPFSNADLGTASEVFRASAYYNEWWRPQGMGGAALYANLARVGGTTALAAIFKPFDEPAFTDEESSLFAVVVEHLIRALAIHRRLRMAQMKAAHIAPSVPEGFVIVDRDMRILHASEESCRRLWAAGLLGRDSPSERIESPGRAIETLVLGSSQSPGGHGSAGDRVYRASDGSVLKVTVVPCAPRDETETWLQIDRPAALLLLSDPDQQFRERAARLIDLHGLTNAEAAVAIEIARGDGRAAAAQRLGIRETTVRSHLTAIFDKVGVHRQAELTRLVTDV